MIGTLSKRQRILAAARELFRAQSFEKATMEEIARALPMSKATLYTEFANKEEILLELCRNHCDGMNARLAQMLAETDHDYLDCLKSMLLALAQGIYDEAASIRTPEALVYESTRIQSFLIDRVIRTRQIVREALDKARQAGEIAGHLDVDELTEIILSAMASYTPPYPRHFSVPSRPTLESITKELSYLLELIGEGLKRYQM